MNAEALAQLVRMPAEPVLADLLPRDQPKAALPGVARLQRRLLRRLPRIYVSHQRQDMEDVSAVLSVSTLSARKDPATA